MTEITWPEKPTTVTVWPLTEGVRQPWALTPDSMSRVPPGQAGQGHHKLLREPGRGKPGEASGRGGMCCPEVTAWQPLPKLGGARLGSRSPSGWALDWGGGSGGSGVSTHCFLPRTCPVLPPVKATVPCDRGLGARCSPLQGQDACGGGGCAGSWPPSSPHFLPLAVTPGGDRSPWRSRKPLLCARLGHSF